MDKTPLSSHENEEKSEEYDRYEEVFYQMNVAQTHSLHDVAQTQFANQSTAWKHDYHETGKLLLLCALILLGGFLIKFFTPTSETTVFQGKTGVYFVENGIITCPDRSIIQYSLKGKDPDSKSSIYVMTYENGFQVTITTAGNGNGISTYDTDRLLPTTNPDPTDYMLETHFDAKSAMLTHNGHVVDTNAWKFLSFFGIIFGLLLWFRPYEATNPCTFFFIYWSDFFHTEIFYRRCQLFGGALLILSLIVMIL